MRLSKPLMFAIGFAACVLVAFAAVKAVRLFQAKIGLPQDGYANMALLLALRSAPSV